MDTHTVWSTAVALTFTATAIAQTQPLEQFEVGIAVDSGLVVNHGHGRAVIYDTLVQIPSAAWIRLHLDETVLGAPAVDDGAPTVLRLTSLHDGGVQHHTMATLEQWRHTSAYFNGGAVRIELLADPGATSRVSASVASVGPIDPGGVDTICDGADDRVLSDDPRVGRLMPIGCTAWIIDDPERCLLTAGHCTGGAELMHFNVPLSSGTGGSQHPGPEDQYAVDPFSMQTNGGGGIGNDWGYFGCFANTETGLRAADAQGDFFVLAQPPAVIGQDVRITGYGVTGFGVPPEWNRAQKTHSGPYTAVSGTAVGYRTDTTGGNSGSPVIDDSTGFAIGIHTHGGCGDGGGQNAGTGINNPDLQFALANPRGVCVPSQRLAFVYPDGLPDRLPPGGGIVRVQVAPLAGGDAPVPGTGTLAYDTGAGPVSVLMTEVGPNVYDAVFPEIDCGTVVNFSFGARTASGIETSDPLSHQGRYGAIVAAAVPELFADDFENDTGWTVDSAPGTDGGWVRGVPVGGGGASDPDADADGSGRCYVTGNLEDDQDLDGGPTRLRSPAIDLSDAADPYILYTGWFKTTRADHFMKVRISDDDGASWAGLEVMEGTSGWRTRGFRVLDLVDATAGVVVRFDVTESSPEAITEGALDAFRVVEIECTPLSADLDGDGDVDFQDLLALMVQFGECTGCPADIDGDGDVDLGDLLTLLDEWTA